LAGPFLDFKVFKDWIELNDNYESLPRGKKGGLATLFPALERLLHAIIFLILHIIFSGIFGFSASACGSKEFISYSFLYKFIFYNIAMTS
jgi:hypothetical protein